MNDQALVLQGITKSYGSVVAVDDVGFHVRQGSRHAVIGPNGAGKSTLFALVAGTVAAVVLEMRGSPREPAPVERDEPGDTPTG